MELTKKEIEGNIVLIKIGQEINNKNKEIQGSIELDIENQAQFVQQINDILDNGLNKIIIDINLISYIDSSGLWSLFECHKKAVQFNGKMILIHPTKDVKRVLDITKISTKIKILESENDAIKLLKKLSIN
tara:strand:- start:176 stop:568 length:393 start_codon:yes stop_codon:yes gene_type:complete